MYMLAINVNDRSIHSNETGKQFGVEKCSWADVNGGRVIGMEEVELSKGHETDEEPREATELSFTSIQIQYTIQTIHN